MDYGYYLRFILSLGAVIAMIWGAAWVLKRAQGRMGLRLHGNNPRLALIEILPLDPKRRLLLVRRDDREHLLLIGGERDIVIENDIGKERRFAALVAGETERSPTA